MKKICNNAAIDEDDDINESDDDVHEDYNEDYVDDVEPSENISVVEEEAWRCEGILKTTYSLRYVSEEALSSRIPAR